MPTLRHVPTTNRLNLISTASLAKKWGVDVRTIHRMVARGQLTPYIVGPGERGAYMFRAEDVTGKRAA